MSPNYVSVLERGSKLPTIDTLVKLARAVGSSPGELLGDVRVEDEWLDEMMDVARRVPRAQRRAALAVLRAVASVRPESRPK